MCVCHWLHVCVRVWASSCLTLDTRDGVCSQLRARVRLSYLRYASQRANDCDDRQQCCIHSGVHSGPGYPPSLSLLPFRLLTAEPLKLTAMATGLSVLPSFEVWKFKGNDLTYPGWASVVLAAFCLIFIPTVKNIKPRKDLPETSSLLAEEENDNMNHPFLNPISEEEHLLVLVPELDEKKNTRSDIRYHIEEDHEISADGGSEQFAMDAFSVYSPASSHPVGTVHNGEGVYSAKGAVDPPRGHAATKGNDHHSDGE